MYTNHKQDAKRNNLMKRPENFNNIEDTEIVASKDLDNALVGNRFGSTRRNSSFRNSGIVNTSFTLDDDKVIREATDILGDLPALHLEHCKL
jgi:hypothetical protein